MNKCLKLNLIYFIGYYSLYIFVMYLYIHYTFAWSLKNPRYFKSTNMNEESQVFYITISLNQQTDFFAAGLSKCTLSC